MAITITSLNVRGAVKHQSEGICLNVSVKKAFLVCRRWAGVVSIDLGQSRVDAHFDHFRRLRIESEPRDMRHVHRACVWSMA